MNERELYEDDAEGQYDVTFRQSPAGAQRNFARDARWATTARYQRRRSAASGGGMHRRCESHAG